MYEERRREMEKREAEREREKRERERQKMYEERERRVAAFTNAFEDVIDALAYELHVNFFF